MTPDERRTRVLAELTDALEFFIFCSDRQTKAVADLTGLPYLNYAKTRALAALEEAKK